MIQNVLQVDASSSLAQCLFPGLRSPREHTMPKSYLNQMFCHPKASSSATSGLAASGLAAVGLAATAAARRSRRSSLVQGQRSVVPVRPGRSLKLGAK